MSSTFWLLGLFGIVALATSTNAEYDDANAGLSEHERQNLVEYRTLMELYNRHHKQKPWEAPSEAPEAPLPYSEAPEEESSHKHRHNHKHKHKRSTIQPPYAEAPKEEHKHKHHRRRKHRPASPPYADAPAPDEAPKHKKHHHQHRPHKKYPPPPASSSEFYVF